MATNLLEFLSNLATEPSVLAEFMADADAVMEAAEVSEDDRTLLKSGNLAAIYARLAGAGVTAPQIVVVAGIEQLQKSFTNWYGAAPPPVYPGAAPPIYPGAAPPVYPGAAPPVYPGARAAMPW